MTIRPYRAGDLEALRRICLLTGNSGADATGRWSSDDLLPDIFLEPYLLLEPETCWVVEQDARPVGYLVSALDTRAFVERWRTEWTPRFAERHGRLALGDGQWLHDWGYRPETMLIPEVDAYPAHLHIDLLPEAQGHGYGRKLMRQLGLAATERGVPGIHLVVNRDNLGAVAFYQRLGFRELWSTADSRAIGIEPERLI